MKVFDLDDEENREIMRMLFNAVVNGAAAYAERGPLDDSQIVNEALIALDLGYTTDSIYDAAMAIYCEASA